jgi:hypothetical protein
MPVPRLAPLVLCAAAGCSLSQPALDGPGGSYGGDAGRVSARGSEACQAWQRASCEFTAERCGLLPAELCQTQNEGVECLDDAQALACAAAFADAPCQRPPEGCALEDVADSRQAVVACENYFDAQCESNVRCGLFDDVDECLDHPQLAFDCNRALSIGLGYEACLDALEKRRCDQSVPICDNVVRAR